jgi:hypothetical protein
MVMRREMVPMDHRPLLLAHYAKIGESTQSSLVLL